MRKPTFTARRRLPVAIERRYQELPLCQGWSRDEIARLDQVADLVEYEAGDIVMAQGQTHREFLIVQCGTAAVCDLRTRRTVGRLSAGGFMGDVSLLEDTPEPYSLVADGFLQVLHIQPKEFRGLLATHLGMRQAVRERDDYRGVRPAGAGAMSVPAPRLSTV